MGYNLVYVDCWDYDINEARGGGRCLTHVDTAAEAVRQQSVLAPAMAVLYGPGEVVVTDDTTHGRVDAYLRMLEEQRLRQRAVA